jgi:hypothetical protein
MKFTLIFIPLLFATAVCSQISFTESHIQWGIHHSSNHINYGGAVSTCDFNDDGLDDLTLGSTTGDSIHFYINNGTQFVPFQINVSGLDDTKQITWIDFDNDGDKDLFVASLDVANALYENDGNFNMTDITANAGLPTHASPTWVYDWGDYNRDGHIDLYIGNYVHGTPLDTVYTNYLYRNNGDGTFTNVTEMAGVADGNKNPLAITWTDYNNDMWPDLMVNTDKMHGNALFENQGNGKFNDVATSANANQHICSMSAAEGDINNDGYLDYYVTNSPPGNVLLVNNGNNTFTESAASSGVGFYSEGWAASFIDFDNDQDQDLYVSGGVGSSQVTLSAAMYENDGTGMFTLLSSGIGMDGDTTRSYSHAYADFNNDGFADIAVNGATPDSTFIWINNSNANNWFKTGFIGTLSNRDGFGTQVELFYGANGYQKRLFHCQNGFMAQNSSDLLFGLGTINVIDSVKVSWPSGLVETYLNVSTNQQITFTEGDLNNNFPAFVHNDGNLNICFGDSVLLHPNGQFSNVVWNDLNPGFSYKPQSSGLYYFEALDPNGITVYSDTVMVSYLDSTHMSISASDVLCFGDSTGLAYSTTPANENVVAYEWSNGQSSPTVSNLSAGSHWLTETDNMGCKMTQSFIINQPAAPISNASLTHINCYGNQSGAIDFSFTGATAPYSFLWSNGASTEDISNLDVGSYMINISDANSCFYTSSYSITENSEIIINSIPTDEVNGNDGIIDLSISGGTSPYSFLWDNGETTEDLNDLTQGFYTVTVTDSLGCEVSTGIYVGSTVGLIEQHTDISVYPNPFNSVLNIEVTEPMEITIIGIDGKTVHQANVKPGIQEIDLSYLSQGLYELIFTGQDFLQRTTIIRN